MKMILFSFTKWSESRGSLVPKMMNVTTILKFDYFQISMLSEEGSIDEGLLPEAEVYTLMRKMQDMNLPVSTEEIQVGFKISAPACASFKTSDAF